MVMESDQALMVRVAANDDAAMALVVARFRKFVYHVARAARVDADDALQEVSVRVWRNAAKYDGAAGSLYTWVARITRNAVCDTLRHKRARPRAVSLFDVDPPAPPAPEPYEPCFDRLSCEGLPRANETLGLYFGRGVSLRSIAASKGVPLATVKSQLQRSIVRMRGPRLAGRGEAG